MTLTNTEIEDKKRQIQIQTNLSLLQIDLDGKKEMISDLCDELKKEFEHNIENLEQVIKNLDEFEYKEMDLDYFEYLVRDHSQYGEITKKIHQLKLYYELLSSYQEEYYKLDYQD